MAKVQRAEAFYYIEGVMFINNYSNEANTDWLRAERLKDGSKNDKAEYKRLTKGKVLVKK